MLRLIFVGVILGVGLIAALRSRFAALQLYVWFALFRPQEWLWFDISMYRLSSLLGLVLVGPCLLTGLWPVIGHPLSLGSLAFLATCFLAQSGATDPAIGWYWLDFMSKLMVVSLLAIRLTSTRARLVTLIGTIAWSFAFHPARSGVGVLFGAGFRVFEGPGGAFSDNNTYAVGCVATLPLLVAFAQNAPSKWLRVLTWTAVPFTIMTIIGTFSRGGLLALGAAVLAFALLQKRRFLMLACSIALLPLLLFVKLPEGYADRISTIGTYAEVGEGSALGRLHFWKVALDMARDRPFGVGLWNFEATYDKYDFSEGQYGTRRAVHNSHLQVLTETGWAGALCWIGLFGLAFGEALRARRRALLMAPADGQLALTVANALIASMCGFLVGGTFVSMAENELTWLTFALIASLDRLTLSVLQETGSGSAGALSSPGVHLPSGTSTTTQPA